MSSAPLPSTSSASGSSRAAASSTVSPRQRLELWHSCPPAPRTVVFLTSPCLSTLERRSRLELHSLTIRRLARERAYALGGRVQLRVGCGVHTEADGRVWRQRGARCAAGGSARSDGAWRRVGGRALSAGEPLRAGHHRSVAQARSVARCKLGRCYQLLGVCLCVWSRRRRQWI